MHLVSGSVRWISGKRGLMPSLMTRVQSHKATPTHLHYSPAKHTLQNKDQFKSIQYIEHTNLPIIPTA